MSATNPSQAYHYYSLVPAKCAGSSAAPRPYGSLLIDLAGRRTSLPVSAIALAIPYYHLHQRILAMRTARVRFTPIRAAMSRVIALLAFAVAVTATVPAAAAQTPKNTVRELLISYAKSGPSEKDRDDLLSIAKTGKNARGTAVVVTIDGEPVDTTGGVSPLDHVVDSPLSAFDTEYETDDNGVSILTRIQLVTQPRRSAPAPAPDR